VIACSGADLDAQEATFSRNELDATHQTTVSSFSDSRTQGQLMKSPSEGWKALTDIRQRLFS
jgi:hypothetical protein